MLLTFKIKNMKKILVTTIVGALLIAYISSCYNNKSDILSLPKVSFLGDVVPIMISSGCGCHNNNNAQGSNYNAYPFTRFDTTYGVGGIVVSITRRVDYGSIIARVDTLRQWANGTIGHPGGGSIDFTASQKEIIKKWAAQGAPYDGGSAVCDVSGSITFTAKILPIYNSACKSSGCHGGRGPVLDYAKMVTDKTILTNMMNSGGSSGHPAGVVGVTSCTTKTFLAWIEQGQPQ
jgi:hypothetical protein